MATVLIQSKCMKCAATLFEPEGSDRTPCPACGEDAPRALDVQVEDSLILHENMRMKGKHDGKGRPFFEAQVDLVKKKWTLLLSGFFSKATFPQILLG